MSKVFEVEIYTDGACSGNPGPGGWAAILRYGKHEKVISGGEIDTTNNRMEVRAALEALRCLKRPSSIRFIRIRHTFSKVRRNGCQTGNAATGSENRARCKTLTSGRSLTQF